MGMEYDEQQAIEFIRNILPDDIKEKYTDDEILYVIDVIWDYYEKKGFLSLNDIETEDELLDTDDLVAYVRKEIASDQEIEIDNADLKYIVNGELEYEESLEDII